MPLEQWMLRITAYADRLIEDLELVDWPEHIRRCRSTGSATVGARVFAALAITGASSRVFTTRPDTLFGATYMVLAPEHPLAPDHHGRAARRGRTYVEATARKSERVRMADAKRRRASTRGRSP